MTADGVGETTLEGVQSRFFLQKLPSKRRDGRYLYRTSGLDAEPGTIILFQCDSRIIASAVLKDSERFDQPERGYNGSLYLDVASIRVFDPVGPALMRDVWPEEFKRFSHSKLKLNARAYPEFERRLKGIRSPTNSKWQEFAGSGQSPVRYVTGIEITQTSNLPVADEDDESACPEGVERYRWHRDLERDEEIARKAKSKRLSETGNLECDACNFDFASKYGDRGAGFIEAHHKTPVSQLDGKTHTKVSDLALVCSNCHRMLHRGPRLLSVPELKAMLRKRNTRRLK
jgi:hypothetical protein